ncbi:MAG TPA: hypothetical protein VF006_14245 [Longimicrobium sp.]
MAYLLIDPPVSPLSPPGKIQEWLDELGAWANDPRYSDPGVRTQIQRAIAKARSWLQDGSPPMATADSPRRL